MKRLFDYAGALVAAVFLSPPILNAALAARLTAPRPALYWSDRVGCDNRIFKMPKFRSVRIDTPAVALLAANRRWCYVALPKWPPQVPNGLHPGRRVLRLPSRPCLTTDCSWSRVASIRP